MSRSLNRARPILVALSLAALSAASARASISDLSSWSLVQDPADAHLTASATTGTATLTATGGPIPAGTDIGFASVDGATPGSSSTGWAFDPSASFALAIDFSLSFSNGPTGTLGIGFGIGEDRDGSNSAGAVLLTNDGGALAFGAAARVNDVNQSAQLILVGATLSGSLFVSYDAASGDITLGASGTQGAAGPAGTATYAGLQNNWGDGLLLASFFLRSDGSLGQPWSSGDGQAVFSNLRVLSGSPTAVPEPGALALVALGGLGLAASRRRRRA